MLKGLLANNQPKKVPSMKRADSKKLMPQGSNIMGNKMKKGTSGLNLDAQTKKLLSKGSALLIKRLSGMLLPEENEEEEAPVIELTPKQLDEDISRMLKEENPIAPKVQVHYSYITNKFHRNELVDQLVIHFEQDGETILKDLDEAKIQEEIIEVREGLIKETVKQHELMDSQGNYDYKTSSKIMRNKFNYNERQTQTPLQYIKEKGVSTAKPQLKNFSSEVNLSWIFDLYVKDAEHQAKEEEDKKPKKDQAAPNQAKKMDKQKAGSIYSTSFKRCLKIMERMIVQNEEEEKYSDYKYMFTEKGPEFSKGKEKNIYPLWRFLYPPNKKKNVTCICWNPYYTDMFAVSFGSYDFGKKKSAGSICLFSIKNTNYPEMVFQTEDGVMCIDFHPQSHALMAVGLYDGVVLVYDVRNRNRLPIYQSSIKTCKHTDPVWQVMWNPDISKNYNFYSISSDGRVMNWILMKDKLEPEEVIRLKLFNKKNKQNDEETSLIS